MYTCIYTCMYMSMVHMYVEARGQLRCHILVLSTDFFCLFGFCFFEAGALIGLDIAKWATLAG